MNGIQQTTARGTRGIDDIVYSMYDRDEDGSENPVMSDLNLYLSGLRRKIEKAFEGDDYNDAPSLVAF